MTESIFRIVLTGAPASGKTDILRQLQAEPGLAGFAFLEELARKLLESDPTYRNNWKAMHLEIYRRQVAREELLAGRSFVTDRGTVDAFAFHPETMTDVGTTLEREYARYTHVIHLGTAAALGNDFYVRDTIRDETIAEAMSIERAITKVWRNHPGYRFVPAETEYERKCILVRTMVRELADKDNN